MTIHGTLIAKLSSFLFLLTEIPERISQYVQLGICDGEEQIRNGLPLLGEDEEDKERGTGRGGLDQFSPGGVHVDGYLDLISRGFAH